MWYNSVIICVFWWWYLITSTCALCDLNGKWKEGEDFHSLAKKKKAWCFLLLHTGAFVVNPALTSTGSNMREGGKEDSSWTQPSMSPLLVNFVNVSHWGLDLFSSSVCACFLSLRVLHKWTYKPRDLLPVVLMSDMGCEQKAHDLSAQKCKEVKTCRKKM